jgi:hypothetical protein
MSRFILLWSDNEGDPHVRLLEGSEQDAENAVRILSTVWAGDQPRIISLSEYPAADFASIDAIIEEGEDEVLSTIAGGGGREETAALRAVIEVARVARRSTYSPSEDVHEAGNRS